MSPITPGLPLPYALVAPAPPAALTQFDVPPPGAQSV